MVSQITGVTQQETVPDSVVRKADQIELVDMAPEALRRRMAHGNIYAEDKVDAALGNYFRSGNLAALRELALLWVADKVDDELQDYRQRHAIAQPWETRERIAVALTGAPGGEDLIRRAGRIAQRAKADLVGIHVRSDEGLTDRSEGALDAHRHLLEDLGGTFREVIGSDIASTLVCAARVENATQLVLGASRRSRWTELVQGSVITKAVKEAADGGVDVHVISTGADGPGVRSASLLTGRRFRPSPLSARRRLAGLVLAVVGLPLLTVVLTRVRTSVQFQGAVLSYLMLVVMVAAIGGSFPALVASVAGFLLLNWFFSEPIHTFTINQTSDVLALVGFLVIAGVVSALVDIAARRHADAVRARAEATGIVRMAGAALREADPMPPLLDDLVAVFSLDGASVITEASGNFTADHRSGPAPPQSLAEANVTVPLGLGATLAVRGPSLRPEEREVLEAFASQVALALEGRRLQEEAARATSLMKANELRGALLAAVSHDLRTPLASIKAGTSSLLSEDITWDPAQARELLTTIDSEADRLDALVANLLDLSRLESGAVIVHPSAIGVDEVVNAALNGLPDAQARVDVDESLPPVLVDPPLLERALANVCSNALSHTPPGTPVRVSAGVVGHVLHLRVIDRGPGVPPEERERVFERFQRLGDQSNGIGTGTGLGLAVARGFIEAMGGEIWIEDTPGGGATVVITLPISEPCL